MTVILEKITTISIVSGDNHDLTRHWCIEHVRTQLCQLLMIQQKVESN